MRVCFGTLCFSSGLQPDEGMATAACGACAAKDAEIAALRDEVRSRAAAEEQLRAQVDAGSREVAELRSQLDKFQSVLVMYNPASPKNKVALARPRKQRAGISAEPQSEASILELSKQTFPTIYKEER